MSISLSSSTLVSNTSLMTISNGPLGVACDSVNHDMFVTNIQDDTVSVLDYALSPSTVVENRW